MKRYELLKRQILSLSEELKNKEVEYINKSNNSGLFAAGLYKGRAH